MTNYIDIDVTKLSYIDDNKYISILYDNNPLEVYTSLVYCPFGLEKEYNNYYVKVIENDLSEHLFAKMKEIDYENVKYIEKLTKNKIVNYNSQIFSRQGYKDFFKLKLPMKTGQFMSEIYNKEGDRKTVYDILPKSQLKITYEIDTIWFFKNKYSSVCKIKKIIIC